MYQFLPAVMFLTHTLHDRFIRLCTLSLISTQCSAITNLVPLSQAAHFFFAVLQRSLCSLNGESLHSGCALPSLSCPARSPKHTRKKKNNNDND